MELQTEEDYSFTTNEITGYDVYSEHGDDLGYISVSEGLGFRVDMTYYATLPDAVEAIGNKVATKVHEGAKLLDSKMPDWFTKVNVDILGMSDYNNCIIGQLFGIGLTNTPFRAFRRALESLVSLHEDDDTAYIGEQYGFHIEQGSHWLTLKELWVEQINNRL